MSTLESRSVFRYFLPSDAFVRILVLRGEDSGLRPRPGLNKSGYQRLVIEACCPEYRGEGLAKLFDLAPCDSRETEDLLYQLCVEVNPELDIHTVRLPPPSSRPEPREPATLSPRKAREQALRSLRKRVHGLEQRLGERVIGQEDAVAAVTRAVRKAAAGLGEPERPFGSFLFVGRTGTGKTELARALAESLFDERRALVRIDCSEYALPHEYAKLIGAPPGYIGHEHGGYLTDAVRNRPDCVVLFDEVEKAHAQLHNLLLGILDEGRLTDAQGRTISFERTLIVLTSNVGAREVQSAARRVGFGGDGSSLEHADLSEITQNALEESFAPEFLGRLGERVLFRELSRRDVRAIASGLLQQLARRARSSGAVVAFSPAVARWVAERGFRPESGARELKHVIQREIEGPLSEALLASRRKRTLLRVSIQGGRPRVTPD